MCLEKAGVVSYATYGTHTSILTGGTGITGGKSVRQ